MKVKEDSENVGLKLHIQKTKIMASGPITSWHIDGETMETVTDFIFLGSKITADGDCSHEIKRCLLLGRKAMTNLDSILKSRDITFPTKVHPVNWTDLLPKSSHLLISWRLSLSIVILEPKKRKSVTASTFPPSICHEDGTRCHDLIFFSLSLWVCFCFVNKFISINFLVSTYKLLSYNIPFFDWIWF